jgi:hypothetical protein
MSRTLSVETDPDWAICLDGCTVDVASGLEVADASYIGICYLLYNLWLVLIYGSHV